MYGFLSVRSMVYGCKVVYGFLSVRSMVYGCKVLQCMAFYL